MNRVIRRLQTTPNTIFKTSYHAPTPFGVYKAPAAVTFFILNSIAGDEQMQHTATAWKFDNRGIK